MARIVKDKRLLAGIFLIGIGVLLLGDRVDLFYLPHWIFDWEVILIAIGTFIVLTSDKTTPGIILIIIGGAFLFNDIFHGFFGFVREYWPLAFIVAGIFIIYNIYRNRNRHHSGEGGRDKKWFNSHTKTDSSDSSYASSTEDYIDEVVIFGGGHRKVKSQNFKGGQLTAVFGGSELDLTQAELAEGVNYLDVTAMFGGWELHIPAHWNVEFNVTPIFGGFDDKRWRESTEPIDNTRKLIVKGVVIFGGGEINNHIVKK